MFFSLLTLVKQSFSKWMADGSALRMPFNQLGSNIFRQELNLLKISPNYLVFNLKLSRLEHRFFGNLRFQIEVLGIRD